MLMNLEILKLIRSRFELKHQFLIEIKNSDYISGSSDHALPRTTKRQILKKNMN